MSKVQHDDEYWLSQINACRTSGLSDQAWCRRNGINTSTFYYHIKTLREKACTIPDHVRPETSGRQEVVQVFGNEPPVFQEEVLHESTIPCGQALPEPAAAVRLDFRGVRIEITNAASPSVIADTLRVLQNLC